MIVKGKPYQPPQPKFKPGQWVYYYDLRFQVIASTHTHSQLDGVEKAIANWELRLSRKRPAINTTK